MSRNSPANPHRVLISDLPGVLEAIGRQDFYDSLVRAVAAFIGSDRYLVLRYARYAKPKFLVNNAMPPEAMKSYLDRFYRIDPLLRMAREGTSHTVITFGELRQNAQDTLFYDEMYRTAQISDELVFFLPVFGGVNIAVCLDRTNRHFSPQDLVLARQVFPILNQLHYLHTNQTMLTRTVHTLEQPGLAMMVLDTERNVLFRNAVWRDRVSQKQQTEFTAMVDLDAPGSMRIADNLILHWDHLGAFNAIAPGGITITVEEVSPGVIDFSQTNWKDRFATNYDLTPREIDIVSQLMNGQTTSRIAASLRISAGTVRNHKYRLYMKLDITTERELFSILFDEMVGLSAK